ncbi:hypothetical protein CCACVL1_28780 [Corchorus capsularis]|uniref:Uncharacterized protein n=1 Tax=Corchorus capsularis TaxID=210143 RepID=A0A1R3G588_COCAP|nr:hypothetical protein CCACVL1_28780 [Corchorus capsularis]
MEDSGDSRPQRIEKVEVLM